FEFAPEIPSLLAGTLTAPTAPPPVESDEPPPALTISEFNQRVKGCIADAFPQSIWLIGEVVDFDKSSGREHRFFRLVEKMPRAQRPKAVVDVAMFARTAEKLLPALERGDPPLTLRDGLEIRALVRPDFYPGSGRFQVIVNDIDPSFTLGKLALTKEQILRELAQKGLLERNRQLGLPVPTLRVGVLTSPDADGWNDFLRHAEESRCGFDVTLFPIKVQGVDLKPTLLRGLAWFAEHSNQFDVLCIVRGGGSRTDLAWFDDREVAIAVARHPLKVIVGIGHQRDQSVLDVIAQSEKTPTAVAELLVRLVESARNDVRERGERLADTVADVLADSAHALAETSRRIARATGDRLAAAHRRLAEAGRDLAVHTNLRLMRERTESARAVMRLQNASGRLLERAAVRLERADTRRRLLDPKRVLQRGFTIVRGQDGRIAPSIAKLATSERLAIQFRDGTAEVHVDATRPDQDENADHE
ncbi:MAG TPA: exodeoxyribonuclease VII large subunit, partial [bacterium]|nr:exodeoxyribonuclease VII large subunit [bacterium]